MSDICLVTSLFYKRCITLLCIYRELVLNNIAFYLFYTDEY